MTSLTTSGELSLKRHAVLVVHEDTRARMLVADMCRNLGFGVVHATRGVETAMSQLQGIAHDIVLCDWGMAAPGGPEFVRSIRMNADLKVRNTPIVLLKVFPAETDVLAARAVGATKLLARPFSSQTLIDTMKQIFASPS